MIRRVLRWLGWIGLAVAAIVLVVAGIGWLTLRASLPRVGGAVNVAGLDSVVEITRDDAGVPTIRGETLPAVACGQGFVHAQERYFQMDLARRVTAGELSELLGGVTIAFDRRARVMRFRHRARQVLDGLPQRHRDIIDAYVLGVNAGLQDLGARPPEYLMLRTTPAPWTAEDSVLMLFFFIERLAVNQLFEPKAGVMRDTLPPAIYEFLTPDVSRYDVPLVPREGGESTLLPIPGPDALDLRGRETPPPGRDVVRPVGLSPGSNNWAVAGSRTPHGGAIVAGDPHLSLAVPNVWYRAQLEWGDHRLVGVGPAGVPGVVMGANESLAWTSTTSLVDRVDYVIIEVEPGGTQYRTPEGVEAFTTVTETIRVKDGIDEMLDIQETRWGPVVETDHRGRWLAMRATFLDPGGADLRLFDVYGERDLDAALDIFRRWKGPSLNWVLGSSDGRVGWIIGGDIPNRVGFDGRAPESWADGTRRWDGLVDETLRPTLIDPLSGVLYTANNRTVHLDWSRRLSRVWIMPARAHRIAERLQSPETFTEEDLRSLQLDVRSELIDLFAELIADVTAGSADPLLVETRTIVADWNGEATRDSAAFRILYAYYHRVMESLLAPLLAPAVAADPGFVYNWPMADEPMRRLLADWPVHLCVGELRPRMREILLATVRDLDAAPGGLRRSWGEDHRLAIRHPLTRAAPALAGLLNMPDDPVPGWRATVRAETPSYGASMRMVVAPGRFDEALFTMPGGQSGHFLSPHYDDGHAAWVQGQSRPLAPGVSVSTFTLVPDI